MSEKLVKAKMTALMGCIAIAVGIGIKTLFPIFMYNVWINSLILLTFIGGMCSPFIHVRQISLDKRFWHFFKSQLVPGSRASIVNNIYSPLLSALVTGPDGKNKTSFTHDEVQHILVSMDRKLGERHTISRYVIGVLVLLGLLGTFWGLTQTVGSITASLNDLSFEGFVSSDLFQQLKTSILSPLSGMGVAFSSSIFGLIGSMVLGFLDLQQGKVEKDLYDIIEDDLLALSKPHPISTNNSGPAYILALLEQTAETLSSLEGRLSQMEDSRIKTNNNWQKISETLSDLTGNLNKNQGSIQDLCGSINTLVKNVQDTNANLLNYSEGQTVRNKIEQTKSDQIVDELTLGRQHLAKELVGEIRMVARMISMLSEPEEEIASVPVQHREMAGS
ncbi:MAG: hypothetical protein LBQ43_00125 [Holosporales bacterium]|jgi:hypothetical protein|nr:hypothetical protein [Holosporales bacterium]